MQNYDFLITYCTLAYNLFKKHKKKAAITEGTEKPFKLGRLLDY